jgi:hypothetical protein
MRVLVTGGTGFLGRHVAAIRLFLHDRGTRRRPPVAERLVLAAYLSLIGRFAFAAPWPVGSVAP